MSNATATTRLNTGATVVAKADGSPVRFANRAQAERHAEKIRAGGVDVQVFQPRMGPVFYIAEA